MSTTEATEPPSPSRKQAIIAFFAVAMIAIHLGLRVGGVTDATWLKAPLLAALILGGGPLLFDLVKRLWNRQFGSDLLAGVSIVTAILLDEYLAGALVVLMLSGGEALEAYAVRSASSVLEALAKRVPTRAHRKTATAMEEVPVDQLAIGETVVVFPHEVCPVDGTVLDGHGTMDEAYLTGEPYLLSKTPGTTVISGAINGETALTIRVDKRAVDSRYAKIMEVMRTSQQQRPQLRRLGDQLGAWYTPLALAIGIFAWIVSGEAIRFLAVMVVATPCPLLIAIPVAIIGSISLAAKRAIIVRDPVALEQTDHCQTIILDKTGTLTYGQPQLVEQLTAPNFDADEVLALVASLEQYSKHPLASAITATAADKKLPLRHADQISEAPGEGLEGVVAGRRVHVTHRAHLAQDHWEVLDQLPPPTDGMECQILVDGKYAATFRFRDKPRREGASFIRHLRPRHAVSRTVLLSGDRESEVRYLAEKVGIQEIYASQSPEQKLAFVQAETAKGPTIFVGDGINDAPALMAATVGVAFGQKSDVTTESADVIVMDSSLEKLDEFLHISRRMRTIALQSAVGGMALSVIGMMIAAAGYLPPVAGALTQEVIDVVAVLNALRAAWPPKSLSDF